MTTIYDDMNCEIQHLCGWSPHPDDVDTALAQLPAPLFADAAPHLMSDGWDGKSNIPLWQACQKINNGKNLPADKQTIGDCVSHGFARAIDYTQCINIITNKSNDTYVEGMNSAMSEAIYGEAREEGNSLNNIDGAAGIWAIKGLLQWGYVPRNGKGYSGQLAKQYGSSGTPSDLKNQGRIRLLQQYAQVKTTKELVNGLYHGYVAPVCSNQGFTLNRDQNGICEAQGSWPHCMLIIGAYLVNAQLIFTILQSWGQNMPNGPTVLDMPDNSFGARESVVQRMLNAGDTYLISAIPGFPAQHDDLINYFV